MSSNQSINSHFKNKRGGSQLLVSSTSDPCQLAGSIKHRLLSTNSCEVVSIGPACAAIAVRALTISRSLLARSLIDLKFDVHLEGFSLKGKNNQNQATMVTFEISKTYWPTEGDARRFARLGGRILTIDNSQTASTPSRAENNSMANFVMTTVDRNGTGSLVAAEQKMIYTIVVALGKASAKLKLCDRALFCQPAFYDWQYAVIFKEDRFSRPYFTNNYNDDVVDLLLFQNSNNYANYDTYNENVDNEQEYDRPPPPSPIHHNQIILQPDREYTEIRTDSNEARNFPDFTFRQAINTSHTFADNHVVRGDMNRQDPVNWLAAFMNQTK